MKLIHRLLLVWLLLLALPFQGIASASMLARVPAMPMPMPAPAAGHAPIAMDGHAGHCAGAVQQNTPQDDHCPAKTGSCADCCAGATMAPAALPALVLAPPHFISIPFRAGHVPSVDPALPDRPPRTALA